MRRIVIHSLGMRMAMLTTIVGIVAAIVPLVAFAGGGDPTGS
jgi:hypothetical protein